MNVRLPFRSSPLAAALLAANLTACAGGSSSTQSGLDIARAQSTQRAAVEPVRPLTPDNERTLACLHCAP